LAGGVVGVTVVHPGGVATSIADAARATAALSAEELERGRRIANSLLTMPPARAADIIVRGVERRRRRIIIGKDAKIASLVERLMPVSYWGLLSRLKGERM
jgi:short-subunit dehydrogenase